MPELFRLQTPDYEFSVWSSDISQRVKMYNTTMARSSSSATSSSNGDWKENNISAVLTEDMSTPSYQLRFSPEIELVDFHLEPSSNQENASTSLATELSTSVLVPKKKDNILLGSPVFFENTQYQFEWVFFSKVTFACIKHRSQNVNDTFRFSKQRGPMPARLTGTINTGNDVGWMRLPLSFEIEGKTYLQNIAFEVLPVKMMLHRDLPCMYRAIDSIYPLWRFSLVEKTEQDTALGDQRGHFPLMWLANFAALRLRFEQGLKVVCAAPHSRLQSHIDSIKASKLKGRLPRKLAERVKQDFASGQYDKRYRVNKKRLSVDTPENRFIKMAVSQSKRKLANFENKLRANNRAPENQRLSNHFLDELHCWQKPLNKILTQSFISEVGSFSGMTRESLVLQQKTGYSAVYRVWQELKYYLDAFDNQSSMSMKSVSEIYEVWCFLCLKKILEDELGFNVVDSELISLAQNDYFEYQLRDGFAGAFCFKRSDGVTARLAHEPKFTKKGKDIRSYLVSQEPDIVLEVTIPGSKQPEEAQKFIWIFDAKYRIKNHKGRYDDQSEDIDNIDRVPDDAINQMHRYRDALIRLTDPNKKSDKFDISYLLRKSRPVFGAFALYPGFFDQKAHDNPYARAIEEVGIGAFALLPSQAETEYCGHQWLLEFLRSQIGGVPAEGMNNYSSSSIKENLYVQEASRIPYSGMQQVLYSDLTMTVALSGKRKRDDGYFEAFEQGLARWYHMPQSTFLGKFKQHVVEEIRYLGLASTSDDQTNTKKIDKLWPVKRVRLLPRYEIDEEQAGKASDASELYYLFELGKPLTLHVPVTRVPHRPIAHSMKLTTLTQLESVTTFADVEKVYKEAMV
ncbi:DUF2357 domain-containing protein [Cobetia marina]|uniref:DUF2357 domain-containing protein n=1 Tax=Cobetia marina TaxID=28258 RepID=UPI00254663FD|nr:DUF2357 domain-containing protein [Cobetia pacifica]MDI6004636.1 DUF2357 domain-containing protein [Cobetia pacifica]